MHLIITHEQADFDAIASLLAAYVNKPADLPVLPRRLNRNVRAYLTLYGSELPFVEFRDLKDESIEQVTLVDTQSMMSIKGISDRTEVHVIDHHPLNEDINPAWTHQIDGTGSTTTILVEKIQELEKTIDLIPATLMLLGIYEDTGSLSYASTSVRDVRACAWLLEQGASLKIAADFLHHPLSAEQLDLYERLVAKVESHIIHGQVVIISLGSVENFTDEVSTLAHKLRDLYDPVALFVIVEIQDHVQLVARASTDVIDVSRVATTFGGGGHSRAAAALIRGKSINQVREEVLELLHGLIKPQKTVEEIMSRDPQLLKPTVTVAQAAESMRRFGHEGYPVTDNGQVIGLLTRRAIDRATSHGLEKRAISEVMNVGNYFVWTTDSMRRLQHLMVESNWGQIPVVDPDTNAIVGIVTRTDLLSNLVDREDVADFQEIRDRLRDSLSKPMLAQLHLVAREAEVQNAALYVVGGFVRDILLGIDSVDFDLVVEGDAIQLAEGLCKAFGGRVSSHKRFGTAKWNIDQSNQALREALNLNVETDPGISDSVDLVSARAEFYTHPTALPSVQRSSIKLDLHRRDFSINTLAIRLDGNHYGDLLDHWGGGRDLKDERIRVLHSLSFIDDPTRMLRAVRLEQRMNFEIEPRTLELLTAALPLIDRVSGERIRNEFEYNFREVARNKIFERLDQLDLLQAIHPSLMWDEWIEKSFGILDTFKPPQDWKLNFTQGDLSIYYAIWMLRVEHTSVKTFCGRLHFPTYDSKIILNANSLSAKLPGFCKNAKPSEIVRMLDDVQENAIIAVYLGSGDKEECRQVISAYLSTWRYVRSSINGEELRERGLTPGPAYSRILGQLRDAWLDGEINSIAQEEELLHHLIESVPSD
jgi:tRNA nucleotidyltransferase (CCA-adding enzyme)